MTLFLLFVIFLLLLIFIIQINAKKKEIAVVTFNVNLNATNQYLDEQVVDLHVKLLLS